MINFHQQKIKRAGKKASKGDGAINRLKVPLEAHKKRVDAVLCANYCERRPKSIQMLHPGGGCLSAKVHFDRTCSSKVKHTFQLGPKHVLWPPGGLRKY